MLDPTKSGSETAASTLSRTHIALLAVCGKDEGMCAMSQKVARSRGDAQGAHSPHAHLAKLVLADDFVALALSSHLVSN